MNLKIGIVGLPNVGKSTLFNALTNAGALAANYPFATIEPNVGIVPVPDERLDVLAKIYDTDKVVPATVEFVDIAGLVAGASKGEGLGNKFLAHIRECQAICHVVRAFKNDDIVRADNKPEDDILKQAKDDIDIINLELQLADEETKAKIAAKRKKDPADELIPYLTDKPVIYMFNVDENGLTDQDLQNKLRKLIGARNEQFEVVRDNGSEIASEPRNDGRERSGSRKEKNVAIRHRTIKKVTEDIYHYQFNTAVAALMEYVNELYKQGTTEDDLVILAKLLKPFAPHLASEMLEHLGTTDEWPTWDDKYLTSDTVTVVVQVNGKLRATLTTDASDLDDEQKILDLSLADKKIQKYTASGIKKTIFIKKAKLVNIVV